MMNRNHIFICTYHRTMMAEKRILQMEEELKKILDNFFKSLAELTRKGNGQ